MTSLEAGPRSHRSVLAATVLGSLGAGALMALAVPPLGWWPAAVVGVAVLDRLLAGQPGRRRAVRGLLVGVGLLAPSTAFIAALTVPGWVVVVAFFSALFALAAVAVPPGSARRLALPAVLVLFEGLRWTWPFGGVPLSTLAVGQAGGPLAGTARTFGALTVVALVGVAGVALSAATERRWRPAAVATAVLAGALGVAALAPRGEAIGTLDVALVQGGGRQGVTDEDWTVVFERHLRASRSLNEGFDVVLWPENVVHVDGQFSDHPWSDVMAAEARRLDAVLVAGVVESFPDTYYNAALAWEADGTLSDRFDKVRRVPYGEYAPFRSLLERVADLSEVPKDAQIGTDPAVLNTGVGRLGVVVSWEVFFSDRARAAVEPGGAVLLNPTNGASFSGTQAQSQQVANSRLRALETGRWVLQAAPTGYTAVIAADGSVLDRSDMGDPAVLSAEVEIRSGRTWAVRFGAGPLVGGAAVALGAAWGWQHGAQSRRPSPRAGGVTGSPGVTPPPAP